MSPKRYEVTDELVRQWAERRHTESFSQMERRYRVPRRVIARRVRSYEKKREQEEGADARLAVLSRFLEKHLAELQRTATVLLEVTAPPSLAGNLWTGKVNIEASVIERLRFELVPPPARLPGFNDTAIAQRAQAEIQELVGVRRGERQAKTLIQDLREHIGADLWQKAEAWEQAAGKYNQSWQRLNAQAREVGIRMDSVDVRALLDLKHRWDEYGSEALLGKPERDWDNMERLLWEPSTRSDMERLTESLDELEQIWQRLEEALTPPQLHKALLAGRCRHCPV